MLVLVFRVGFKDLTNTWYPDCANDHAAWTLAVRGIFFVLRFHLLPALTAGQKDELKVRGLI